VGDFSSPSSARRRAGLDLRHSNGSTNVWGRFLFRTRIVRKQEAIQRTQLNPKMRWAIALGPGKRVTGKLGTGTSIVPVIGCKLQLPTPLPHIVAETPMTEERKHAILFAATLLCARKLIETIESDKPNFAEEYFVDRAIRKVEFILEKIDKKFQTT